MYHKIDLNSPSQWWVSVDNFHRQMIELSNKEVVYLDDYDPQNPKHVVITFDGVYKDVVQYALPVLKKFKYPFELFITSNYLGKSNDFDKTEPLTQFIGMDDIYKLITAGGRLQWHTMSHPNLAKLTNIEDIKKELTVPKEIKKLDPLGFKWFAYPYGEFNNNVIEIAKKSFTGAVSCNQGNDENKFKLNRLTITNENKFLGCSTTVIIASYNYGRYLIEAIESVLRQTILPNEILITDDCSLDNTQEIALDYVKRYPDLIKYNRNKKNLGIVDHFNKAIKMTQSDYICILGADNRLFSNYIEESIITLNKDSKIGVTYTDMALFGPRAKLVYEKFPKNEQGEIRREYFYNIIFSEITKNQLAIIKKSNFVHGSSMFRRKAFNEIGGYIKGNSAEDHNLFMRILEKGWKAKKTNDTYIEYRQHSRDQANEQLATAYELQFYKNNYKKMELTKNKEIEFLKKSLSWKIVQPILLIERYIFISRNLFKIIENEGIVIGSKKCLSMIFNFLKHK